MNQEESVNRFAMEIDYYRSKVDELSGVTIRMQYQIAEMSNEIEQLHRGFDLIAGLQSAYTDPGELGPVYNHIVEKIVIRMNMDMSMILLPLEGIEDTFYPAHYTGFPDKELSEISCRQIQIPHEFLSLRSSLLVNSQTSPTCFISYMKEQFLIPFFVLTPILFHGKISGFLFAGRKVEAVHLAASRLMIHDTNALEAIAGIISTFMIQKEQINLIETERNRISRELHDDIGAELTRIIVLGQLLQKQMTTDEQMLNKLRKISESGKKVLGGIGEIIWTMNKQNDNLESLFAYIRRFVSEYLEMNGIEVNIAFPDEIPSVFIHDEWRRSIFLVIKEAVHNITKYAQASRVNLEMEIREGLVWLKIYDDGVGFCDTEKSGWGNGLNNMEQRMKDIGGTIEIRSEKGRGTRIRLSFAYC